MPSKMNSGWRLAALSPLLLAGSTVADCSDYPFVPGLHAELVQDGLRLVATGRAAVAVDNVETVAAAEEDAAKDAKVLVARFVRLGLFDDEEIERVVSTSVPPAGEQANADQAMLRERLLELRGAARTVLKDVMPLDRCHTEAREVRVSVELGARALQAALELGAREPAERLVAPGEPPPGKGSGVRPLRVE